MVSSRTSAINRQLSEGLKIEACDPTTLISGRGEFGSNRISRMRLTLGDEVIGNHKHIQDLANLMSTNEVNPDATMNVNGNKRYLDTQTAYNQVDFSTQFKQRKIRAKKAKLSTEGLANSLFQPPMLEEPRSDMKSNRLKTTGGGSISEVKDVLWRGSDNKFRTGPGGSKD